MTPPRTLEPVHAFGELPFQFGARAEPSNGELADRLPFTLGVDPAADLLVQMPDRIVEAALADAYRLGAPVGTPLAESGPGKRILDDFLGFVLETLGTDRLDGRSILEIGSGEGALLRALADRGADVTGVDPGARAQAGGSLTVIAEPFRPELFDRRFDSIVHYALLEHLADPVASVRDQLALLADGGSLVFSVPDCTVPVAHGDISMLFHEHWSYFTGDSLAAVAALAGAEVRQVRSTAAAGTLYSSWRRGAARAGAAGRSSGAPGYAGRARGNLARVGEYLAGLQASETTLGVFCPSRFVNYQELLVRRMPHVRYFDDDPFLEGRYYPPSPAPVESRASLLARPVAHLLVASWSYGERIAASLRAEPRLADTAIVTIADLLRSPALERRGSRPRRSGSPPGCA
jgi:SAM-dependent methyltransferase